ncbi:hypothetical protein MASR1M59_27600 [Melaminivora sp.]
MAVVAVLVLAGGVSGLVGGVAAALAWMGVAAAAAGLAAWRLRPVRAGRAEGVGVARLVLGVLSIPAAAVLSADRAEAAALAAGA